MSTPFEVPLKDRVLGQILSDAARHHGDKLFVRFRDDTLTYDATNTQADIFASSLYARGLTKGDKVAMMLPNSPAFVLSVFGLAKGGMVAVPINTAQKGPLLSYLLSDSDARALIIDTQWLDRISPLVDQLPKVELIVVVGDGVCDISGPQIVQFADLFSAPLGPVDVDVRHTDLQAIMYTSGTTGPSKGVEVTHCHCISFALDWIRVVGYKAEDVLYTPLPLFHAMAHTLGLIPVLLKHSQIVIADRFSASQFWSDARGFGATIVQGISTMASILLKQASDPMDRDHNVRLFYSGRSEMNPEFTRRFGAPLIEAYGATETGMVTFAPDDRALPPGSCGKANLRSFEVEIHDDDDNVVEPDVVGEIVIRPKLPYIMTTGYYNKPNATSASFRNLWFHTGDRARMDEEGYVYFVDRKADAMRREGENVSSYEVEREVNTHPDILESAAIGVPSELGDHEIKICVVLKQGRELDPDDLIRYLDERLPRYMLPRYVEFMPDIPKTSNQKTRKVELRQQGENGITSATWDRTEAGRNGGKVK